MTLSGEQKNEDYRHEGDDEQPPNVECLWDGARAYLKKSKALNRPVVEHVKRVVAAQVFASGLRLFPTPWFSPSSLSEAMSIEWKRFLDGKEQSSHLNRDEYNSLPTADEAKKVCPAVQIYFAFLLYET